MRTKTFSLPAKYRLEFKIIKGRKNLGGRPLLPRLEDLRRVRKGSKLSRAAIHIFEHKKIKQLLGANLAVVALAGSIAPNINLGINPANVENSNTIVANVTTIKNSQYPTANTRVNQGYTFYHAGVDFEGNFGDEVKSFKNGVVAEVGYSRFGYGNAILVDHGDGLSSLYAHLTAIYVGKDQSVDTGTVIGTVGSTGRSTGSHLHFEVRLNGQAQNPFAYLP